MDLLCWVHLRPGGQKRWCPLKNGQKLFAFVSMRALELAQGEAAPRKSEEKKIEV